MITSLRKTFSAKKLAVRSISVSDTGVLVRLSPHHVNGEDPMDWEILLSRVPQTLEEINFSDFYQSDCLKVGKTCEIALIPCTPRACKWFIRTYMQIYETTIEVAYIALTGAIRDIEEPATQKAALDTAYVVILQMNAL